MEFRADHRPLGHWNSERVLPTLSSNKLDKSGKSIVTAILESSYTFVKFWFRFPFLFFILYSYLFTFIDVVPLCSASILYAVN